ncbi:MAG TPA: Rieske 2Fe-2S domain-containing protein [Candidatus Dormibacteraeota bacterium]
MDPARPSTMQEGWSAALLDTLEQQPWLDKVGRYISELLQPLLDLPEARPVKDILHGTWLGHSLHPVLTDLPIGFWSGSLLLDLFGAGRSAGLLSAAGSTTAVATAITGVTDWTVTDGREKRLGLLHGLLNVAGLALQVASLQARLGRRRSRAVALSAAGLTVSSAAAWLGGELVFGRGMSVNHDAWTAGPEKWTPVLPESRLADGAPQKVEIEGRAVLVYREGPRVFAMENACAHAGGPLDEGEASDGVVTCPWHGSQFSLRDGALVRGPSTFPQLRLQARIAKGQVEVRGRQG